MQGTIINSRIIEQLQAAFSEESDLVAGELGAPEETVRAKMQQSGRGLSQRLVDRDANGYKVALPYEVAGGSEP